MAAHPTRDEDFPEGGGVKARALNAQIEECSNRLQGLREERAQLEAVGAAFRAARLAAAKAAQHTWWDKLTTAFGAPGRSSPARGHAPAVCIDAWQVSVPHIEEGEFVRWIRWAICGNCGVVKWVKMERKPRGKVWRVVATRVCDQSGEVVSAEAPCGKHLADLPMVATAHWNARQEEDAATHAAEKALILAKTESNPNFS